MRQITVIILVLVSIFLLIGASVYVAQKLGQTQKYSEIHREETERESQRYYHKSMDEIKKISSTDMLSGSTNIEVTNLDVAIVGVPTKIVLTQVPAEAAEANVMSSFKLTLESSEGGSYRIISVSAWPYNVLRVSDGGSSIVLEEENYPIQKIEMVVVFNSPGTYEIHVEYTSKMGTVSTTIGTIMVYNTYPLTSVMSASGDEDEINELVIEIPLYDAINTEKLRQSLTDYLSGTYKIDNADEIINNIISGLNRLSSDSDIFYMSPSHDISTSVINENFKAMITPVVDVTASGDVMVVNITVYGTDTRIGQVNSMNVVQKNIYVGTVRLPQFSSLIYLGDEIACTVSSSGSVQRFISNVYCSLIPVSEGGIISVTVVPTADIDGKTLKVVTPATHYSNAGEIVPLTYYINDNMIVFGTTTVSPDAVNKVKNNGESIIAEFQEIQREYVLKYDIPLMKDSALLDRIVNIVYSDISESFNIPEEDVRGAIFDMMANLPDETGAIDMVLEPLIEFSPKESNKYNGAILDIKLKTTTKYELPYERIILTISATEIVAKSNNDVITIRREHEELDSYGIGTSLTETIVNDGQLDFNGVVDGHIGASFRVYDLVEGTIKSAGAMTLVSISDGEVSTNSCVDVYANGYEIKCDYTAPDMSLPAGVMLNIEMDVSDDHILNSISSLISAPVYRVSAMRTAVGQVNIDTSDMDRTGDFEYDGYVPISITQVDLADSYSTKAGATSTYALRYGAPSRVYVIARKAGEPTAITTPEFTYYQSGDATEYVLNIAPSDIGQYIGGNAIIVIATQNDNFLYDPDVRITDSEKIIDVSSMNPLIISSGSLVLRVEKFGQTVSIPSGEYTIELPVASHEDQDILEISVLKDGILVGKYTTTGGWRADLPIRGEVEYSDGAGKYIISGINIETDASAKYVFRFEVHRGASTDKFEFVAFAYRKSFSIEYQVYRNVVADLSIIGIRIVDTTTGESIFNEFSPSVNYTISFESDSTVSLETALNIVTDARRQQYIQDAIDNFAARYSGELSSNGVILNPMNIDLMADDRSQIESLTSQFDFVLVLVPNGKFTIEISVLGTKKTIIMEPEPFTIRFRRLDSNDYSEIVAGSTITVTLVFEDPSGNKVQINPNIISVALVDRGTGMEIPVDSSLSPSNETYELTINIPKDIESGIYDVNIETSITGITVAGMDNSPTILGPVKIILSTIMGKPLIILKGDKGVGNLFYALNSQSLTRLVASDISVYALLNPSNTIDIPMYSGKNSPTVYVGVPCQCASNSNVFKEYEFFDAFDNFLWKITTDVVPVSNPRTVEDVSDLVNAQLDDNKVLVVNITSINTLYVIVPLNMEYTQIGGGKITSTIFLDDKSLITLSFHPFMYISPKGEVVYAVVRDFTIKKELQIIQSPNPMYPYSNDVKDVSVSATIISNDNDYPDNYECGPGGNELTPTSKTKSVATYEFMAPKIAFQIRLIGSDGSDAWYCLKYIGQAAKTEWRVEVYTTFESVDEIVEKFRADSSFERKLTGRAFVTDIGEVTIYAVRASGIPTTLIVKYPSENEYKYATIPVSEFSSDYAVCVTDGRVEVCVIVTTYENDVIKGVAVTAKK